MKKITGFSIIGLLSFLLINVAIAQNNVWTLSESSEGWSETYFADVPGGHCTVGVKKNGSGLFLIGIDYGRHRKLVEHTVNITKRNDQISIVNTTEITYNATTNNPARTEKGPGDYQVFTVKCFNLAKKLPNKVKDKFFGCCGIQ